MTKSKFIFFSQGKIAIYITSKSNSYKYGDKIPLEITIDSSEFMNNYGWYGGVVICYQCGQIFNVNGYVDNNYNNIELKPFNVKTIIQILIK